MHTVLHPPARRHRAGRRSKLVLAFAVGLTVAIAGPLATAAGAEVSPGCNATLAGQDVGPRSSTKTSDAIDVEPTDQIVAGATSAAPIDGYKVQLEAGGFKWTVAKGAASGNSWQRSVSVKKYASHGVGLYKVIGTSTGAGACTGAVLVNVKGKSPLTTTAGIVGLALTAIGGLGLVAGAVRARRAGTNATRGVSGAMPPSTTGRSRGGWRPRVSPLGMLSGAVGGLGAVVLLQQFAVAYPTRGLVLTGVVGGALLSLLTTNLVPRVLVRGEAESAALVDTGAEASLAEPADMDLTDAGVAAWAPTHSVPASGLTAWAAPGELSGVPADKLDPGLEVAVVEQSGSWAHIRCSNGWSAWVDGEQLVELGR